MSGHGESDEIRPFLAAASAPTRPLGAALPALATAPAMSPWTPRPAEAVVAAPVAPVGEVVDLAALEDEARERGFAEGLAQSAALRAQLAQLIDELAAARAQVVAPATELVADVAACVIEAWIESTAQSALFAPVVRAWGAQSPSPARVRVHPGSAAALAEAIGDAPLTIVPDPGLAPGALVIRSATLELAHDWRARLDDLRVAIAAALADAPPADAAPADVPGGAP